MKYSKWFFTKALVLSFLFMCNILLCNTLPANAQQSVNAVLDNLKANTKLKAPDDILADFVNGKPETAVIIILQPTSAAKVLAAQSQLSAKVPSEFTRPEAPAYYNLQDKSIRKQLHSTVIETVGQVINRNFLTNSALQPG
jgi:hypothetical protein